MDLNQQRKFFILEFSSWAERFLRCMTPTLIVLLGIVTAQTFFSIGGVDAQYLVYTFGLLVLAVGAQFLVFWARIGRGFRVSGVTAWFFPWLLWLALDMFFFSETPWRARYTFCLNLLPLMSFFVAIHTSREKKPRWWLIALTAMLALLSGLVEFLQFEEEAAQSGGENFGQAVREIFSTFGSQAGIGAVLLLAFFPIAMMVVSPRFKLWARFFGFYMATLFLLGIVFTRHIGVYLGLIAGGVLAVLLLVRRRARRIVLWGVLAIGAVLAFMHSNTNVGCFRSVPVSDEIRKNFTAEEIREGVKYLLPYAALEMFKENPVFGVGAGRFSDAFEKYRTPQWQTNPRTPGSLYLYILAEHGLVGLCLFLAPVGLLMVIGIRACRKMPWFADTEYAALRRKMGILDFGGLPEERIALAGTLSGLLAVGVLFAVDYPRSIPGVAVSCGIFGGIAGFLLSAGRRRMIVYSGPRRHWLLPIAFLVPVILLFAFLPTFHAESEYQKGMLELNPFYSSAETGMPKAELDFEKLDLADSHLRSALRKEPKHGDAWAALSAKFVFECQRDPMNAGKYGDYIRWTSERALVCSEAVPVFYYMRATAEMMDNDFDSAKKSLKTAFEMAPMNAPLLLEAAEAYRAFPQGVEDATRLLERVNLLLPTSRYVETIRALISFGEGFSGEDKEEESSDYVIPVF